MGPVHSYLTLPWHHRTWFITSHTQLGGGTERGTEKSQRETQDKESMRLGEDTIVLIEEYPSHVAISSSAFFKALL